MPLSRDDVYQQITPIFRQVLEDRRLVPHDQMTARDVPQWDSLNHLNLVIAVEQKFGIKFLTAELARLENVGQFVDSILQKVNG